MLYTKRKLGWVDGIPSGKLTPSMRQIQTDNGEGTVLRVTKKDNTFVLEIVQYNESGRLEFTGYQWELTKESSEMSVQKLHDKAWRMEGDNGALLQIDSFNGDVQVCILHKNVPDTPSQVPSFSQSGSGGKSLTVRTVLTKIVCQLKEDDQSIQTAGLVTTYYNYIERLYEVMIL